MSRATAKTHVSRLLAKLDARDRAQLVVIAYESGLARAPAATEENASRRREETTRLAVNPQPGPRRLRP